MHRWARESAPTVRGLRYRECVDASKLRISDADRARAAEILQAAVGDGYITLTEFEERSAAVFAATTRAELDAPLSDLPTAQQTATSAVAVPETFPAERQELRGEACQLERKGFWRVPSALSVRTRAVNAYLDFTEAAFASPVVDIDIDDKASHLQFILPDEATVDYNGLDTSWSNVTNKVSTGPQRGNPHFVLHGKVRLGNVLLRHLGRFARRRRRG